MTDHYDVVVVGAGPGGTSAAKAAADKGARTILLEEHPVIGHPRHCTGRLHASSFTRAIMDSLSKHVILCECRSRRFYSPRGRMILESPVPSGSVYMVLRDEFDRELARQAASAGATIALSTRATGLIRDHGKVQGVATNSKTLPAVYGKLVTVLRRL